MNKQLQTVIFVTLGRLFHAAYKFWENQLKACGLDANIRHACRHLFVFRKKTLAAMHASSVYCCLFSDVAGYSNDDRVASSLVAFCYSQKASP